MMAPRINCGINGARIPQLIWGILQKWNPDQQIGVRPSHAGSVSHDKITGSIVTVLSPTLLVNNHDLLYDVIEMRHYSEGAVQCRCLGFTQFLLSLMSCCFTFSLLQTNAKLEKTCLKIYQKFWNQNFENLFSFFCENQTKTVGGVAIWKKKFDNIHTDRYQSPTLSTMLAASQQWS